MRFNENYVESHKNWRKDILQKSFGSSCGTRISWRKDVQKLDLSWDLTVGLSEVDHGVRELSGQLPTALRSPEMEEATLSRLRVKYEVVTPLGDEDILD